MNKNFVIVRCLFLLSCSKSGNQNSFVGTWELREYIGGWSGIHNYPEGNGNTITFSDDGRYSGTVVSPDTSYSFALHYKVVDADECGTNISFYDEDPGNGYRNQVVLSHDTLTSWYGGRCIVDGDASVYVRK